MYFFTQEEHEELVRFHLPRAREHPTVEELRGWSWAHPPLEPIYNLRLGVSEVASLYCQTRRDCYLRRVQNVQAPPNLPMIYGSVFHALLCDFVIRSKRALYMHGPRIDAVLADVEPISAEVLNRFRSTLLPEQWPDVAQKAEILHQYEFRSLGARLQEVLSHQPRVGIDALVSLVLPLVVEQKLDGTRLGLSPHLSCDAVHLGESVLIDLKFGPKRDFHILGPTGYALVLESLYEYPINIGCVVYVNFGGDGLRIEKEFKPLTDEVRSAFIEERDQKMRMIYEEIDPGLADLCYEICPFRPECRGR